MARTTKGPVSLSAEPCRFRPGAYHGPIVFLGEYSRARPEGTPWQSELDREKSDHGRDNTG